MNYRNKMTGLIVKLVKTNLHVSTIETPSTDYNTKLHTMSTVKFHKAYVEVS